MTLRVYKLRQALVRWFGDSEELISAAQAESRWATIYHDYAREGEDVSGEPAINLSKSKFSRPLNLKQSQTAQQFCRQLDQAFVSYWTGVTFATAVVPSPPLACPNIGGTGVFSVEISSVVTVVAKGVLYGALIPIVSSLGGAASTKAAQFAEAFDSATKTAVTVLITGQDTTPPPAGPLAITNVCTVF